MSDGSGEGFEFEPSSFGQGADEMLEANSHLTGAAGQSESVQGSAGEQLRQWLPTVPAAETIDKVEATADEALSQATNITREDAEKLLTQKQTMLTTEARITERIEGIRSGPVSPETGPIDNATPSQIELSLSQASPFSFDEDGNPIPANRVGANPNSDGRYPEPEGLQWHEVRNAALDQANDLPRPPQIGDPKMASALRLPDGKIYTGSSNGDVNIESYPELKSIIDSIPAGKQSQYGWRCAEVDCITKALDDRYSIKDLEGAQSSAAQIRGLNSAGHGTWREPCTGDKYLLGLLKISW